jgi:hypothetical protein
MASVEAKISYGLGIEFEWEPKDKFEERQEMCSFVFEEGEEDE